jgi:hypothetical protein
MRFHKSPVAPAAAVAFAVSFFAAHASAQVQYLGPTPYLCTADSPIANLGLPTFFNETFEDHLINTPGLWPDSDDIEALLRVFGGGACP